jgi:hypothetical protein
MLFTFAYLHLMLNIVAVIFAFRFPAIPAGITFNAFASASKTVGM